MNPFRSKFTDKTLKNVDYVFVNIGFVTFGAVESQKFVQNNKDVMFFNSENKKFVRNLKRVIVSS
jgi:hypothetical protein